MSENKRLLPLQTGHAYDRPMRAALTAILAGLLLIGIETRGVTTGSDLLDRGFLPWDVFLIVIPLTLIGLVWTNWTWPGMACVIYGTVGLALDLATLTGAAGDSRTWFTSLNWLSGSFNLLLIVAGWHAFVRSLWEDGPPRPLPPNPPAPSSSPTA